jgi:hypothetical protein
LPNQEDGMVKSKQKLLEAVKQWRTHLHGWQLYRPTGVLFGVIYLEFCVTAVIAQAIPERISSLD